MSTSTGSVTAHGSSTVVDCGAGLVVGALGDVMEASVVKVVAPDAPAVVVVPADNSSTPPPPPQATTTRARLDTHADVRVSLSFPE
jgi:hypothetical protein